MTARPLLQHTGPFLNGARLPFRFVHTADLHLDSPLRSLALRHPALAERVGTASRQVLTRIVDLCLAEAVDALLIAGDLYDDDQTSMKTAGFLAAEMRRLEAAGIRVYLIRGNHDAISRITRELVFPPNVHVFGGHATTEVIEAGRPVAIHGLSFAQPHAPESLLPRFPPPLPGAVNIGMLHTSLGGSPAHDRYAPCAPAELMASGYDYWALGHVHLRAEHAGRARLVMPGIPQGRDIGESGEKSVSLVGIADTGEITVEPRSVALLRFERLAIPLDGLADWAEIAPVLRAAFARAQDDLPAEHLVLRPRLTGATPLAWRLRRDRDLALAQAASEAEAIGNLWIDSLDLAVTDPAEARAAGAIPDLARLVAAAMPPDAAMDLQMQRLADDLVQALPRDLRDLLGNTDEAARLHRAGLLEDGAAEVLAALRGTGQD